MTESEQLDIEIKRTQLRREQLALEAEMVRRQTLGKASGAAHRVGSKAVAAGAGVIRWTLLSGLFLLSWIAYGFASASALALLNKDGLSGSFPSKVGAYAGAHPWLIVGASLFLLIYSISQTANSDLRRLREMSIAHLFMAAVGLFIVLFVALALLESR